MKLILLIVISYSLSATELLFNKYCLSCHLKQQITFKQMKAQRQYLAAPPISVVMERIKHAIVLKIDDEDVHKAVVTAYVKDYTIAPDIDKGLCHANCFVQFGVMPSQQGKIEPEELDQIASWLYDTY